MEAMLDIRFLASGTPTGPWHWGRIDSFGLDENGTPALIEYKKCADSGVFSELGRTVQFTNLMPFGPRAA
ncbi:hypothetical protein ACIPD2_18195 [Streptomyces griseofuscus]|uniref:hypothetical protein n=1 Tax=Streptomyces griseofuscus TaxID=146922 RepID=UPI0026C95317